MLSHTAYDNDMIYGHCKMHGIIRIIVLSIAGVKDRGWAGLNIKNYAL